MKIPKINKEYVFKHTVYPEDRYFKGEFKNLDDAKNAGAYNGMVKLAGKRFIVKDVQAYLSQTSFFLYVPELNICVDYFWSYLKDHVGDVVNCNRVWLDLNN